ncbi:MAG: hypothetical protein QXV32_03130 [Conexivisphaerales archaeon]
MNKETRFVRILLILAPLVGLCYNISPLQVFGITQSQQVQLNVSYGYGPSQLLPFNGIPVFTSGDQLWLENDGNATVNASMTDPAGKSVVGFLPLPAGEPVMMHTFSGSDVSGLWNITLQVKEQNYSYSIYLTNYTSMPKITLEGVKVYPNGTASAILGTDLSNEYNPEFCIFPTYRYSSNASVTNLSVLSNSAPVLDLSSFARGAYAELFGSIYHPKITLANLPGVSVEVDFLYDYASYTSAQKNGLLIQNLLVSRAFLPYSAQASSLAKTVYGNGTYNLTSVFLTHPREGGYTARFLISNASYTLTLYTRALVLNDGTVLTLQNCNPVRGSLNALSFNVQIPTQGNSTFEAVLLYGSSGVESFSIEQIALNLTDIEFLTYPWNTAPDSFNASLGEGQGILANAENGNNMYLSLANIPFVAKVNISFMGVERGMTIPVSKTGLQLVYINSSKLLVNLTGQNYMTGDGAIIVITSSSRTNLSRPLAPGETFYLPAGEYNVTAIYKGQSKFVNVTLQDGKETIVTFSFERQGYSYLEALLYSGIIGVIISVLLWGYYLYARRNDRIRIKQV